MSLLWEVSTSVIGNILLNPLYLSQAISSGVLLSLAVCIAFIFLMSPCVGFLADIKFGRLAALKCGTYTMTDICVYLQLPYG